MRGKVLFFGVVAIIGIAGVSHNAHAGDTKLDEPLAGDPAAGHKIFQQICSLCHSDKEGVIKIGPPLWGDYGRKAGTFPGFHYSDAIKAYGQVWSVATLQPWEESPRHVIPGTKMSFPGLKNPKDRNDIIAYLQTLHH
jgi:cytochrome c